MENKTIMIVEDNQDDLDLTMRALKKHHVLNEIIVARDGAEALEYLIGREGKDPRNVLPELILLDLKMPKIDGLEVLRRIRAHGRTKHLPVVILTSSDEENDIVESYEHGANSYVRKPVDFERFVEAANQLSLYWLVLNEFPHKKGS